MSTDHDPGSRGQAPRTTTGRIAVVAERTASRLGPHGSLIVLLGAGLALALLLSVAAAQVYDNVTDEDGVAGLDEPILRLAISLRTPLADAIVTGYTDIAGPIGMPILAVVALLVLSIRRRSWTPALLIASAGIGSLLMTIAGKNLIGRVRPPLADAVQPYEYSPSFPSGHTLNAVVVAGAIAYLLVLRQTSRIAKTLTVGAAALFAITIGLSRVYLGHHWFTDVLAGWILGAAWLTLVITAHRLVLHLQARRRRAPGEATTEEPTGPTRG
jgi:membrane-associated phospholipid phosphatase